MKKDRFAPLHFYRDATQYFNPTRSHLKRAVQIPCYKLGHFDAADLPLIESPTVDRIDRDYNRDDKQPGRNGPAGPPKQFLT